MLFLYPFRTRSSQGLFTGSDLIEQDQAAVDSLAEDSSAHERPWWLNPQVGRVPQMWGCLG